MYNSQIITRNLKKEWTLFAVVNKRWKFRSIERDKDAMSNTIVYWVMEKEKEKGKRR